MIQTGEPDWAGMYRNRERPTGPPAILQTWHDLVFLHARIPVEVLQAMVPSELIVEEFDGSSWLGFVPFWMSCIRHPRGIAAPWLSSFHETNVRTYVTHSTMGPGVWFFSLDAARYLACWYARKVFKLPYFHAIQSSKIDGEQLHYEGRRKTRQLLPAVAGKAAMLDSYKITVQRHGPWHTAEPKTFEFWLVERYRLYSRGTAGRLLSANVFHSPYEIAEARASELRVAGLETQFGELSFESALLAKTLNVLCFSPHPVSLRQQIL